MGYEGRGEAKGDGNFGVEGKEKMEMDLAGLAGEDGWRREDHHRK